MHHNTQRDHVLDEAYRSEKPWRTLIHLYRRQKRDLAWAGFWYVLKVSPTWVVPLVVAAIIDTFGKPREEAIHRLVWCSVVGGIFVLQNVATHVFYLRHVSRAARSVEASLRLALCHRLQELSISFFRFQSSGTLQSKVMRDVESVDQMARQVFDIALNTVVMLTATLSITALRAPMFLPVYLLTVPVVTVTRHLMQERLRSVNQRLRREIEGVSSSVSGMIEMVPVTRAHAVEQVELEKLQGRIDRLRSTGQQVDEQNALFGSTTWAMFQTLYLFGLVLASVVSILGLIPMSAGEIVMFSGFFGSISGTVMQVTTAIPLLTRGFESVRSIGEVVECPDLEQNKNKPSVSSVRGDFSIENVSYVYPNKEGAYALDQVSLRVPAGQTVAVVGPSGCGKSTLMGLLLGYYRPSVGRILIDGRDMNEIDLRSYRRHLAVVSQETILFPGTIRENILYGMTGVSEPELMAAVRSANALEFIQQLPNGLDTVVGEHGSTLSGGQRQRIAVARALIRDPQILILDEATSALDVSSEALVQEALDRLMVGRTSFIVAHRLSTTRKADVMVVMEAGRIVEVGPPQELMSRPDSRFAALHAVSSLV